MARGVATFLIKERCWERERQGGRERPASSLSLSRSLSPTYLKRPPTSGGREIYYWPKKREEER